LPTYGAVQAALAELRLALGREVHVGPVPFQYLEDLQVPPQRIDQHLGFDQRRIVGGGVILGILAMRRARERADREIETRRAILPLVVAVRSEVAQAVLLAALGQHV